MRRWWWLSLLGFFALGAAWALALPANGSYDEKDHIVRAYAVAGGQLKPATSTLNWRGFRTPAYPVPAGLLPTNDTIDCTWVDDPPRVPSCQVWRAGDDPVLTPTGAARYSPVYYLPVGLPLRLSPDMRGILLARLLSALLSAALLAGAVSAAARLGSRLLPLGILLAATPLVPGLTGAVNPNGLEISAGVLAFSALLALLRAPGLDGAATRRLLVSLAVAVTLLLTLRQLGPALLGLAVLACVPLARPGRLRALARRRDARLLLGGAALGGAAYGVGWVLYSGLGEAVTGGRVTQPMGLIEALSRILTVRAGPWAEQVAGQFGYGEVHLPLAARLGWYLLVAALVVPALALSGRRARLATVGVAVACFVLLVALDLYFLPRLGWFSQGRYAMPALVGVVLIPASGRRLAARLHELGWLRPYVATLAGAAALLQLYALMVTMTRFQAGTDAATDPFAGDWHPLVGSAPPVLAEVAGLGLLVAVAWRATRTPVDVPPADGDRTAVRVPRQRGAPRTTPAAPS